MYYDFLHRRVELVARLTMTTQTAYDLWREIGYGFYEPAIPRHRLNELKGVELCVSGIDLNPRDEQYEPLPFGRRQRREVQIRWHNGAPLCQTSLLGVFYEQGNDRVTAMLSVWWPFRVAYLMEFDPKAPWNENREYQVVDWQLPELPLEAGIQQDATRRLIELLEQERVRFPYPYTTSTCTVPTGSEPEGETHVS